MKGDMTEKKRRADEAGVTAEKDIQEKGVKRIEALLEQNKQGSSDPPRERQEEPQKKFQKIQEAFAKREKMREAAIRDLTAKLEAAEAEKEAAEAENEKLRAQEEQMAQFLERQSEKLLDRCAQLCAAQPYADLLHKWLSALQDLMGLARALDEFPEAGLRERWAEQYLQRVKWLRLDPPAAEDDRAARLRASRGDAWKGGLPDMMRWWARVEREIAKNAGALRKQALAERLRPMLEELQTMGPADCLRPEGLALLRRTAETAETGLREVGVFPEFYDSQRIKEQMEQDQEVADAFNEGNSASVEIPALFLARDGRLEMLSGYVGMTRLKTER